jgi:hypothetical protein
MKQARAIDRKFLKSVAVRMPKPTERSPADEFREYDDMLFLYRLGSANWSLWAGSMRFQWLIHEYGSQKINKGSGR